jgi:hypothetical protein
MPRMSPDTLKSILQAEKSDALAAEQSSKLSQERQDANDYYLGDVSKDLPSIDGRSKVVSMDVADTVEGLMPSLMEVFCGSDDVVKFEPVGPEDVKAAEQETDYVNHVFMQQNPGFLVLYSFVKDALLQKVGVAKVLWEEEEREESETYLDQPEEVFAAFTADPEMEVVEHTEHEDPAYPGVMLHDVKLVKRKTYACAKVEPVPPEEFGISRRARSIKDANYCFHEVVRTEGDLIDSGYDPEQVKKLQSYSEAENSEAQSRDTVNESTDHQGDEGLNKANRPIRVTEHYIRMDYDGNNKTKLYRVTTGGEESVVLSKDGEDQVTEVDFIPFAAMTPVIVTHRFFGRSIADLVMDIQRIKTVLLRALLDNTYLANNPRPVVAEEEASDSTLDDLLVSRPGSPIRVRRNANTAVVWQQVPTIGNHIYPLLEYQDSTREWRTGVTKQGQGIDADALQNQTATASNQLYNAAQARMKLIARIFAETGVKDLFTLLHATIRKHGKQAQTVRLKNQWVQVDPRNWKTRNDMVVNVGLGSGGQAEQLAEAQIVAGLQEKAMLGGLPIVGPKQLYNTGRQVLKVLKWKDHDAYFVDPESEQGQKLAEMHAQKPDPEVMKLQAEAQLKEREAANNAKIEETQALADIETNRQKTAADMAAREREYQLKERLALIEAQLDREKAEREEARKDREHEAKVQALREGHFLKTEQGNQQMAHAHQTHQMSMAEREAAASEKDAE